MTKCLALTLLDEDHRGHQHAGVADDQPSRLEDHPTVERARVPRDDLGVGFRERRRVVVDPVGNAEAAADVDVLDRVAVAAQDLHEVGEQGESVVERREVGNLRADVHVDPVDGETGQCAGAGEHFAGARDRHAELVLRLAGRDLGVGPGVDVRVDADGDRGDRAARRGDGRKRFELRFGLHVEAEDLFVEAQGHLGVRLADAGEDDLVTGHAGGASAPQFAFAHHVHAGAERRQRPQHRLVGVGFHGVGDQGVLGGEGVAKTPGSDARWWRWNSSRTACRPRGRSWAGARPRRKGRRRDRRSGACRPLFQQEVEKERLVRRRIGGIFGFICGLRVSPLSSLGLGMAGLA